MKINGSSRRPGGKCENAEIEFDDRPNVHFPDRRAIKAIVWCETPAEYRVRVDERSVKYLCEPCAQDHVRTVEARGEAPQLERI
jgi:hypothetical protein